ncbi:hypothetical protein PHISP_07505 [Aspergillus sp. HF37]|nr:hypothetical protein PHISP_07505 [Aspergillus sp. HF37]
MSTKSSFDTLSLRKHGPRGNAWSLFGAKDELRMLNLLTPETTTAAAKEIVDGIRVSTDWPLDSMRTPCFGRSPFEQTMNTNSQLDGYRHFGYQKEGVFFNGCTQRDIDTSRANGITVGTPSCCQPALTGDIVWVENGGIVGRGVLLDFAAWAEAKRKPVECFQTSAIPISVLQEVAASQNTTFRPGDILFVRTGWTKAYKKLSHEECQRLASRRRSLV